MKSGHKIKIVPHWEPGPRIAIPLHYRAPVARRAPEFVPDFLHLDDGPWQKWTPLQ